MQLSVLASLLRQQIRERGAAAIVITHDLAFAAAFADRFWFMDRGLGAVEELPVGELPPGDSRTAEQVWRIEQRLGEAVLHRLEDDVAPPPGPVTACRSIECVLCAVGRLVSLISTVSPSRTRTNGPGTVPPNVQKVYSTPLVSVPS